MRHLKLAAVFFMTHMLSVAHAEDLVVPMNQINESEVAQSIGTVKISETRYGLVFTPSLENLPTGTHGFHVHENNSCQPKIKEGKSVAGLAAGGHYDPANTKHHDLPWGEGHLGDLPALVVDQNGKATYAVLAPRLKLSDVKARSLMIHAGGDNHNDHPTPLGGGGVRMACGVIPN